MCAYPGRCEAYADIQQQQGGGGSRVEHLSAGEVVALSSKYSSAVTLSGEVNGTTRQGGFDELLQQVKYHAGSAGCAIRSLSPPHPFSPYVARLVRCFSDKGYHGPGLVCALMGPFNSFQCMCI